MNARDQLAQLALACVQSGGSIPFGTYNKGTLLRALLFKRLYVQWVRRSWRYEQVWS